MHLNRATFVYGIMLLACAVGAWAVLSFGQGLIAPEDLAGKWTLEPRLNLDSPTTQATTIGPGILVDQSGKFFQIAFDNGPKLNFKLTEQTYSDSAGTPVVQMILVNEPWRLTIKGPSGGDDMSVNLIGPEPAQSGVWNAHRSARTFPADIAASANKGVH